MPFTLDEIAKRLNLQLDGNGDVRVTAMSDLGSAAVDSLCFAESDKYAEAVAASNAAAVIVGLDFPDTPGCNLLRAENPRLTFLHAMELFSPDRSIEGIHPSAIIADDAQLGEGVGIAAGVVVDQDAVIGDGVMLRAGCYIGPRAQIGVAADIGANVVVMDRCKIGARCILHPGVVIGSDGYGYQWLKDHHHKVPQLGGVVVEDDVEIGANTCIDRATLSETRIGVGTKLDNLVHIAHNNVLGCNVLLTAQVGIAGSSEIGNGVVMGGQAAVSDHIKVGDGVQVGGQAGITKDIEAGSKVWGTPARSMGAVMREQLSVAKLPDLQKTIRQQNKAIEALQARLDKLESEPK